MSNKNIDEQLYTIFTWCSVVCHRWCLFNCFLCWNVQLHFMALKLLILNLYCCKSLLFSCFIPEIFPDTIFGVTSCVFVSAGRGMHPPWTRPTSSDLRSWAGSGLVLKASSLVHSNCRGRCCSCLCCLLTCLSLFLFASENVNIRINDKTNTEQGEMRSFFVHNCSLLDHLTETILYRE